MRTKLEPNGKSGDIPYLKNRETGKWEEASTSRDRRKVRKTCEFIQIPYKAWVEYARQTRDPRLAVIAELYRLYFETWEKKKPFAFGLTKTLQDLGVSRMAKARVLQELEILGWIKVKRIKGKASTIQIVRGFYLKRP